jgi:hypothetical protein
MSRIEKITVTIETDTGNTYTVAVVNPHPQGDNPAFMSQQFMNGMEILTAKGTAIIGAAHGVQVNV